MSFPARPESVDFHFDVMCPYAYQTSLWIREVRDRTGLEINWRFFSLEEINRVEGKKHPWEREWSYGWSMMRIGALLRRRRHGAPRRVVRARPGGRCTSTATSRTTPRSPASSSPRSASTRRSSTRRSPTRPPATRCSPSTGGSSQAGGFGVPTLFFPDGQCLFGPVLIDPPAGEAAERLWDAVVAWTAFPHLYEIQRPKSRSDAEQIAETFEPYLRARDWVSINRGEVVDFAAAAADAHAATAGAEGSVGLTADEAAKAEQDRLVELLGQEWSVIGGLLAGLGDQDWVRRALPGWDVHDVIAHIIGTERMLAGGVA